MGGYKMAELVINEYYDKLHDFSLNLRNFQKDTKETFYEVDYNDQDLEI